MASGRQDPFYAAKTRRRLEALTKELAEIKTGIESADAEIIRFWLYHLELQHRAARLAGDMDRLKNRR